MFSALCSEFGLRYYLYILECTNIRTCLLSWTMRVCFVKTIELPVEFPIGSRLIDLLGLLIIWFLERFLVWFLVRFMGMIPERREHALNGRFCIRIKP